jgi:predicted ferric reductase
VLVLVSIALRMRHIFGFDKSEYLITGNKEIKENIWVLEMKSKGKKMKIRAGQYVYIQPGLKAEEHPFSVLNFNNESGTLAIGYKVYGRFTKNLTKLKIGNKVLLDGPYGVFTKETSFNPDDTAVFIAGGIGVTPFIKHCLSKNGKQYLFYAVRSHSSAAFLEILRPILGSRLILVYSDESTNPGQNEEKGYINKEILRKYLPNIERFNYYLCGPSLMMKSVNKELLDSGVSKAQIHSESFSF